MAEIISSNKGKYNDFSIIEGQKELMFTPDDSAQKIMDCIIPQLKETDIILEPFKGNGAFYDKIPYSKDYCEIDDGIDFFNYNKKVDWAI